MVTDHSFYQYPDKNETVRFSFKYPHQNISQLVTTDNAQACRGIEISLCRKELTVFWV